MVRLIASELFDNVAACSWSPSQLVVIDGVVTMLVIVELVTFPRFGISKEWVELPISIKFVTPSALEELVSFVNAATCVSSLDTFFRLS